MESHLDSTQSFEYSPISRLNNLEIHYLDGSKKTKQAYWIVYIHGGAWRDPAVDASSIATTLPYLTPVAPHIIGIASLNYQLSPYPGYVTNPSDGDPARNVAHPQQIEDVMTAICWLQYKYGFEDRYVLVGHSAGATLAFQSVSGIWNSRESTKDYPLAEFVSPVAIAGAAGIYDLKALVESFPTIPAYRNIIEGAFGKNEQTWKQASPVNLEFHSSWAKRRFSVIADSREDELIDQVQGDKMYSHLFENISELCKVSRLELQGDHDSIWSQGSEMAKVITHVVELLRGNS